MATLPKGKVLSGNVPVLNLSLVTLGLPVVCNPGSVDIIWRSAYVVHKPAFYLSYILSKQKAL